MYPKNCWFDQWRARSSAVTMVIVTSLRRPRGAKILYFWELACSWCVSSDLLRCLATNIEQFDERSVNLRAEGRNSRPARLPCPVQVGQLLLSPPLLLLPPSAPFLRPHLLFQHPTRSCVSHRMSLWTLVIVRVWRVTLKRSKKGWECWGTGITDGLAECMLQRMWWWSCCVRIRKISWGRRACMQLHSCVRITHTWHLSHSPKLVEAKFMRSTVKLF